MKFFVPGFNDGQAETAYQSLFDSAKEQLRTAITPRRIFSLQYVHDKHVLKVVVGETHPDHPRNTVLAILESQPHIVMTKNTNGRPGPTIMVASHEITDVTEFD